VGSTAGALSHPGG